MEKFRYYVVYWSKVVGAPPGVWTPSAQVMDRDKAIETEDDIRNVSNLLAAQRQQIICVTDWKRIS